ncbi:hypothetical protein YB2330_005644 [Saitoella coloradoensis]
MLQLELLPRTTLDPRLRQLRSPDGKTYYLDPSGTKIYKQPVLVSNPRGGVLSEEMGTGKTLICLALVLATKHQSARLPDTALRPPSSSGPKKLLRLMEYAARKITWDGIPYVADELPQGCLDAIDANPGWYEVYASDNPTGRTRRVSRQLRPEQVRLSAATLVVVPDTLIGQWRQEVNKHTEGGTLRVLTLFRPGHAIPPVSELLGYDLVLISQCRFSMEEDNGGFEFAGVPRACRCSYIGATRIVDCHCPKKLVRTSPLMGVHWKRIVVDEGHSMGSGDTRAVRLAGKLRVERRWCVTGTPSSGLMSVNLGSGREEVLASRLTERGDLERLGAICVEFLRWEGGDAKIWSRYVTKPYLEGAIGSADVVRTLMAGLFVRNRIEDVAVEVSLPPLHIKTSVLEPSYYNTVALNVLMANVALNAVTSERVDQDYFFHPSQTDAMRSFVTNLMNATFYWTGTEPSDVEASLRIARRALEKGRSGGYPADDVVLLEKSVRAFERALGDDAWLAFYERHAMGYGVEWKRREMKGSWPLVDERDIFSGESLLEMQKWAFEHGWDDEERQHVKFLEAGEKRLERILKEAAKKEKKKPAQALGQQVSTADAVKAGVVIDVDDNLTKEPTSRPQLGSSTVLSPESPLNGTNLIGTASAKLTYLLQQVLIHSRDEKIIIFSEYDDVMYYIGEALEIFGVKHLIYVPSLGPQKRSQYIVTFNSSPDFRVLIMNLKLAAHGLNVSTASRVFFVHPVWQPSVEAQAIKRAHRIGQSREVFVETLVLGGTVEEELLNRRRGMSTNELTKTKTAFDDGKMKAIISATRFVADPLGGEEPNWSDAFGMAVLETEVPLFEIAYRGQTTEDPDADLIDIDMETGEESNVVSKMNSRAASVVPGTSLAIDATIAKPSAMKRKVSMEDSGVDFGEGSSREATVAPVLKKKIKVVMFG